MKEYNLDDVYFFDIETTGLPKRGAKYDENPNDFPYIVQISWIFKDKIRDFIIKPEGYEMPHEAIVIHGITNEMAQVSGSYR